MFSPSRRMPATKRDRSGGFTLVELLIVIVILGILAGIVVFAVGNLTSNATANACATEKATISTALEAYKAQNTVYPAAMSNLTTGAGALLKTVPTGYGIGASNGVITPLSGSGVNPNNCG